MVKEITLKEFKNLFNYMLDNNKVLEDNNQKPLSIGIEGIAGCGKTSMIESVAKERGMSLCTLCLSQLEEVGDLVGFPIKEYEIIITENNKNTIKWIPESLLKTLKINEKATGKTRMSYAPPAWIPRTENPNGTIFLLDDWTRATPMFIQAAMEIINQQKYISWKLPKYTTVCLSANPDNGAYNVASIDDAVLTRFLNYSVKFEVKEWAEWAESVNMDSRCINFALYNGEELFKVTNNQQIVNARSYTNFCKAISYIKDWHKADSLETIYTIAKGAFLRDENNIVGTMFTSFINNKLDKLITPEDIINKDWSYVKGKLKECIYNGDTYKPEIASLLTLRLTNYILYKFSIKGGTQEATVNTRLAEIVDNEDMLLSEDMLYHLIKTLCNKYPARTTKLLSNPNIRKRIV